MSRADEIGLPLAGYSVIVGRAAADSGSLAASLRALGAEPILIPLVTLAAPADGGRALGAALDDLDSFQWLAFTSANGVRAMADALGSRRLPRGLKVAAVGPATAAAAESAGFVVSLTSPTATATDLAEAFPEPARPASACPESVLAPLAELASSDLEVGLAAKGYQVERVDAYRMEPTVISPEQRQAATEADAVLFTAPSYVDRYLEAMASGPIPPVVICIGPRTAARTSERGITGAITASPHDEHGLIQALVAALAPMRSAGR